MSLKVGYFELYDINCAKLTVVRKKQWSPSPKRNVTEAKLDCTENNELGVSPYPVNNRDMKTVMWNGARAGAAMIDRLQTSIQIFHLLTNQSVVAGWNQGPP